VAVFALVVSLGVVVAVGAPVGLFVKEVDDEVLATAASPALPPVTVVAVMISESGSMPM
jgi:hypothetical protein